MAKNFNIVVLWLYDPVADKLPTGGMERWCRDAARLVRDHGFQVRIWQKSVKPFIKVMEEDITIHGVPASLRFGGNRTLAKNLQRHNLREEPFLFVSQEILGFGDFPRAVAVNHGIWWNGDNPWWKRFLNKRLQRKLILQAKATICVDTNYINWCHAELPGRTVWQSRLFYVPNYADGNLFKPSEEKRAIRSQSPVILFPRRVSGRNLSTQGRGVGLLIQAVEILEAQGVHPRLIFAGRGELQSEIAAWAKRRDMGDRVEVTEVTLDQMPELYERADVVVVPSLEHEGTSLSAVEALCSGKPLVVSHIGGLCNIVVDRLNGYVCDLTPESLARAIREAVNCSPLYSSPELLENCRKALGKDRWERQVWSILQSALKL